MKNSVGMIRELIILTGILTRMNLLCYRNDIYNKRTHAKNYFHTNVTIASNSGHSFDQSRHQK